MYYLKKNLLFTIFILSVVILSFCKGASDSPLIDEPDSPPPQTDVWVNEYLKVSSDGQFIRDSKPYYGIGVNYFDAFYRLLRNDNTSYIEGLKTLSENNIPFIRFTLLGFWPRDMNKYLANKQEFYRKLDRFIAEAEKNKIGLIPTFFWNYATIPDVVGERVNQWENPDSKTLALMKQCTDEIVQRYKDKNIIWAWEFSNEINIYVDPMGRTGDNHKWMYTTSVNIPEGTPSNRTFADSISTDALRLALKEFSGVIRKHDPDRVILTGNGMSHPGIYKRYTRKIWSLGNDSPAEYTLACDLHNPSYIGTITIHPYPSHEKSGYFQNANNSFNDIIRETMRSSKELKRPLFVGEFGADKSLGTNETAKFNEYLSSIISNKVQLSALWVFDYSFQNDTWNITATNSRKYQLEAIKKANIKFQSEE